MAMKESEIAGKVRIEIRACKRELSQLNRSNRLSATAAEGSVAEGDMETAAGGTVASMTEFIERKQVELNNLMQRYAAVTGGNDYRETDYDLAMDFCEDFFFDLTSPTRNLLQLAHYFDRHCSMSIIGYKNYTGGEIVMKVLMVCISFTLLKSRYSCSSCCFFQNYW